MNPYVAVLHITASGEVMLQQRDDKPEISNSGKIGTFGGEVEQGETLIEAAIRETEEELSIKLRLEDMTYFSELQLTKERHGIDQLCHFYLSHGVDPKKVDVKEGQGYVLVSRDNLDKTENMALFARDIVSKYFLTH